MKSLCPKVRGEQADVLYRSGFLQIVGRVVCERNKPIASSAGEKLRMYTIVWDGIWGNMGYFLV